MQFTINKQTAEIDLLAVQDAVVTMGQMTQLQVLRLIQKTIKLQGIECSVSSAWQIWETIVRVGERLKLRVMHHAEIAFWYNVNPFTLNEFERIGLLENLDRVQCQDRIHRRDFNPTDYEGVYRLFKMAFGNEALADKMKTEAFKKYIEQQTKQGR